MVTLVCVNVLIQREEKKEFKRIKELLFVSIELVLIQQLLYVAYQRESRTYFSMHCPDIESIKKWVLNFLNRFVLELK
jgi:hypothetical protein